MTYKREQEASLKWNKEIQLVVRTNIKKRIISKNELKKENFIFVTSLSKGHAIVMGEITWKINSSN